VREFTIEAAERPDIIPKSKVKVLGTVPRRGQFVRLPDGSEAQVAGPVQAHEYNNTPHRGERWIEDVRKVQERGEPVRWQREIVRAFVTEAGTYERAKAAADAAAKAKADRQAARAQLLPVDRLALLDGSAGRPQRVVALRDPTEDPIVTKLSRTPAAIVTDGEAAAGDLAGVLARLEAHGVTLQVVRGHLLVRAMGGRLDRSDLAALDLFRPLIVAHLSSQPTSCALPHRGTPPEATTLLAVDVPSCQAHASDELEAKR
jgi:hypothetical protein